MSVEKYPIHWIQVKSKSFVGICGRTRQVYSTTGNTLRMIVVRDFYVERGRCEEGTRCVNTDCDLNRSTLESFSAAAGYKRVPKWLKEVGLRPIPMDPEFAAHVAAICEKYPSDGIWETRK